jgi:hypothetical protein
MLIHTHGPAPVADHIVDGNLLDAGAFKAMHVDHRISLKD